MRLTEKNGFCYVVNIKPEDNSTKEEITLIGESINKIGELEDIEEELGIDLITFIKALKNGVCYFTNGKQLASDYVYLIDNYMSVGTREQLSYSFITAFEKQILSFNDYGKTWALTEEELEDDK